MLGDDALEFHLGVGRAVLLLLLEGCYGGVGQLLLVVRLLVKHRALLRHGRRSH